MSQQTLLALCALAVAGMFMQSVTQASIQAEIGALRSEVNMTAAGILQETFDWASQLKFDELSPAENADDLTPQNQWQQRDWEEAVALENLNGITHAIQRAAGADTLHFDITAQVDYMVKIGETWTTSENRTMTKRLTFTVTGPLGISAQAQRLYSQAGF